MTILIVAALAIEVVDRTVGECSVRNAGIRVVIHTLVDVVVRVEGRKRSVGLYLVTTTISVVSNELETLHDVESEAVCHCDVVVCPLVLVSSVCEHTTTA